MKKKKKILLYGTKAVDWFDGFNYITKKN